MKTNKIVITLLITLLYGCTCFVFKQVQPHSKQDRYFTTMMNMCENYTISYLPLYCVKQDTFVVSKFNIVPSSINDFLIKCAENNDFRPLKYALSIVVRQNIEYNEQNKSDYIVGEGLLIEKNGFIILIRKAMNIGNEKDSVNSMNYFDFYTGDICLWMEKHKKMIIDYGFIQKYRKKQLHKE